MAGRRSPVTKLAKQLNWQELSVLLEPLLKIKKNQERIRKILRTGRGSRI